jgi:hypothetical protein
MKRCCKLLIITGILLIIVLAISCTPPWESLPGGFPFNWSPFISFPFGIIGLGLYFLPTIIAAVRHTDHLLAIVLINIFAGWTFIGWVVALVWSLVGKK